METNAEPTTDRRNRLLAWLIDLPLARKLLLVVGVYLFIIFILLFFNYVGMYALSGVRAYVGGEGLWSKSQKDAVYHLLRYAKSRDEKDYQQYKNSLKVNLGDRISRLTLDSKRPDHAAARRGFIQGRNNKADVDIMITLFLRGRHIDYIAKAISIWEQGDAYLDELMELATELHAKVQANASQADIDRILVRIGNVNARLTPLEDQFSFTLGEAARWLRDLLQEIAIWMTVSFVAIGAAVSGLIIRQLHHGVSNLKQGAARISQGDFASRIPIDSDDELGHLARSFNAMTDSLVEANRKVQEHTQKLLATLREQQDLMEGIPDVVLAVDQRGRLVKWNSQLERVTGLRPEELRMKPAISLVPPGDQALVAEGFRRYLVGGTGTFEIETLLYNSKGETVPYCWSGVPLKDADGTITGAIGTGRDITERKRTEQRLNYLAHYDALTGLANRTLFYDQLRRILAHATRYTEMAAIFFVDLDRFKAINDTMGHDLGDRLLQSVASRLTRNMRATDSVARLSGDEFVVAASGFKRIDDFLALASKLQELISQPFVLDDHEFFLTPSIGISVFPNDASDPQTLLKHADTAMYRAKEQGRNQYQLYSAEMADRAQKRMSLEYNLRRALEHNELELYYQPLVHIQSGRILGVEALLRWHHPDHGLISPAEFIPLAEETGLIVPIGEWVLEAACTQAHRWHSMGIADISMSVNLSARQFLQPDLLNRIERVLAATNLPAHFLNLELTETAVMQDVATTNAVLVPLHAMGAHISIDDFGTGYSSLSYLKRFPIDTVKIDGSFVRDITTDRDDAAIVTAIVTLSHSLGLQVIAEAVETAEQLKFLRQLKCDGAQGYLISRPVPAEQATEFLSARSSGNLARIDLA